MTASTLRPDPVRPTPPLAFRHRVRRTVALFAAGGMLAGAVGVAGPVVAAAAPAAVVAVGRGYPGGGFGSGYSQSATVDSSPATAAEERGVALIDTVLTNGEAAGTGVVLTADG